MAGSKYVTEPQNMFKAENQLSWLTEVMWSDLNFLSSLRPFNENNLSMHILQNQSEWDTLFKMQQISFDLLPNKSEIDLEQFQVIDIRDAIDAEDEKFKVTVNDKDFRASKSRFSHN